MEIFTTLSVLIIYIIGLFVLFRNQKVSTFRGKLIDMCGDYNMRHIEDWEIGNDVDAFVWLYGTLPTYTEMLYSFKPLKLGSYITKEQYERLIS
jgi:hypothetical protein